MAATVARMTKHELKEIIESTVEQKLLELLGDPDQGLVLKKTVKDRLLRQRKAVASGQRGESLSVIVKRFGRGWVPSLLAQRAASEGPRSMRAVEGNPAPSPESDWGGDLTATGQAVQKGSPLRLWFVRFI
jgi:hypothetical protein